MENYSINELLDKIPPVITKDGKKYRFNISKVNNGKWFAQYNEEAPTLELLIMFDYGKMLFGFSGEKDFESTLRAVLKYLKEELKVKNL